MNKLFIHIGTHKTGSTALQQELMALGGELRKVGFHWNAPAGFAKRLLADATAGRITQAFVNDTEYISDFRARVLSQLENCSAVISSEHFSGNPRLCYKHASACAKALAMIFEGIPTEIIVYYRRQDSFCESLYTQGIHERVRV